MTFIIAIQLDDSVIVASDNRSFTIRSDEFYSYGDLTTKLNIWNRGVIAGSGEVTVIERAIDFFVKISEMDIQYLPKCLKISRLIRELETTHDQITRTKLLYSHHDDNNEIKLFTIIPDGFGEYTTYQSQKNEIIIWLYHPNTESISSELRELYTNLHPFKNFNEPMAWFDFYIAKLKKIYEKQSKVDGSMSQSFHYFFHAHDFILHGLSENNQLIFTTAKNLANEQI